MFVGADSFVDREIKAFIKCCFHKFSINQWTGWDAEGQEDFLSEKSSVWFAFLSKHFPINKRTKWAFFGLIFQI